MLLVTSLPCSTSFRCPRKQQSPSVSSRDSLLRMDGSGTITCWPVTPFGLINVPRPATTNAHTHTQSINHTPLWLQRMQDFYFPEPERELPAPPPSPWKYTNTQWHAIPEPKCTQTHTQPLQVACTEEGGSIVMKDTMKLGGSTPASQDLLPSHFQCVLHDSHREARAVTQPSPRTTPPEEILFNTLVCKKKICWAKTNKAPSTQFIHLCRPGFLSLKHQTQSNNSAFSTMSSTALQSISSAHKQGDFKVSGSGHSSIAVLRGIPEQCSSLIQVRTNTRLGTSLTHNPLQFERVHIQCPH